jgi:hypothetical protein
MIRLALVFLFLIPRLCISNDIPFVKYPAEIPLVGKRAPVSMRLRKARQFRTVLRLAAAEGPNFNGHYRIAVWGCGTNCIEWAIINLRTGSVWFAPDYAWSCYISGIDPKIEEKTRDWLESKIGSSLLALNVCEDEKNERIFDTTILYRWKNNNLIFVSKRRIK